MKLGAWLKIREFNLGNAFRSCGQGKFEMEKRLQKFNTNAKTSMLRHSGAWTIQR